MKTRYNLRVIGVTFILTVLACVGIFLYSRWDYQRFVDSLGEVPEVPPEIVSQQTQSISILTDEPKSSQEQILEPTEVDLVTPESESLTSEMETDELTLTEFMSFLDEPDELEVSSLSDSKLLDTEAANVQSENTCTDADHGMDPEALRSRYGDSPDVEVLIEVNKLIDAGIATTDDMIDRAEAWLRLLPENDYRNRQEAMDSLEHLYQTKADIEAGIVIETIYYRISYF